VDTNQIDENDDLVSLIYKLFKNNTIRLARGVAK